MAIVMNKEVLIRMPLSLYKGVKSICGKEYKSISALVREVLLEKVEESLSEVEMKAIEKESKLFHTGKGIDWRKEKRG